MSLFPFFSKSNNQLIDDIPTPTTAPVKISESEINEEDSIVDQEVIDKSVEKSQNDYPLWSKLPYVQENFKISHYIKPMVLLVKIKDESVKNGAVETEINKWLEENGFGKESHQMEWQTVESF